MTWMLMKLRRQDERALNYLVGRRRRRLDPVVRAVTHLGDAAVTVGVVAALLLFGNAGWSEAGRHAAFTLIVSHVFVQLLKRSVSRPRPVMPVGFQSLIAAPDRFSFPSGHAAAALSVTLAVAPLLPGALTLLALAAGVAVGVSRCYLGVHYPGDVMAGWLLAVTAALLADPFWTLAVG